MIANEESNLKHLMDGVNRLREVPVWLRGPLQSQRLLDALRGQTLEVKTGKYSLLDCKAKRLFLKDTSGSWEGTFNLKVRTEPDGQEQNLLLHGRLTAPWLPVQPTSTSAAVPFGSPDWQCFLPELQLHLTVEQPEAELASLSQLVDPDQSRVLLESALHSNGHLPAGIPLSSCSPVILSYKSGSRCTIRYDLEFPGSQGEVSPRHETAIGKIYRKASKAQNAYEGMLALWQSPLAASERVAIAEPLAFLPEQKAMIQGAVPGEKSLEDLLKSSLDLYSPERMGELLSYVRKTAAGLAALHRSGVNFGKITRLDERFFQINDLVERLVVPFPEFRDTFTPLLDYLSTFAARHPEDSPVPTHGTFNPEQVLIQAEQISLIDFDDYSMAEPAKDVGLFRAAIKDTGMNALNGSVGNEEKVRRERMALLDDIADVFLAEYQIHAPISEERVALWEALDYFRNCLHTWVKVKPAEPDYAFFTLEHQLLKILSF